jgi:5-(carboxyamino)imidazole ribonucleotide synthase
VAAATEAWASLGGKALVIERLLTLDTELSVMVARHAAGDLVTYPPSVNHHEHGILAWSVTPGPVQDTVAREAVRLGEGIATQLGVVGLLAIELFLTGDGKVIVNELAPRPHNSFHQTERACLTSQFEQLVRAVCGLPLGSPEVAVPGAIHNLLGDLWTHGEPRWSDALAVPGVRLHLYGKRGPRPGRKMGHLSSVGDSAAKALDRVLRGYDALRR